MADCGLLNLGSCLVEKLFEFILSLINAPTQTFLNLTLNLLSEPINLSLFSNLWAVIIYVISMFYALLLIYSGFNFIVSGYDSAKRENAKSWLRNVVIMIVLIQASFFIYQLTLDLSSSMTSVGLTLVDPGFYTITTSGIVDMGLAIIIGFFYVITLVLTCFILILRYAFVAIGVVLFPLAIFFYFIPPLKNYGQLIINFLGICIFVTFLDAVLLIGFSQLVNLDIFTNLKPLVLISAFGLIDLLMFFLMFFSIIKSAINITGKIAAIAG